MPALGMAQETGRLVRWLKREGERVSKGEPLMEVETDKATVEVESPATGTLSSIAAAEGDDVVVGRAIALILAEGESGHELKSSSGPVISETSAKPAVPPAPLSIAGAGPRPPASPKARRLAAERGVDIGSLRGSGPGGAVIEDDVLQSGPVTVAPDGALWRAMAENVTRSWREAPHFFVVREVDASTLTARRRRGPEKVTFTDLIVEAVARALRRHPRMNGMRHEVNIGLAVAVADGLIVPVIHGADTLDISTIAARRGEMIETLKQGKVRSSDLGGGTFTVSNLGMYGVDLFTAILTEGQAGILAVGRITDRVVAEAGEMRIRPTMALSLTCDHRRIDGARAAEFMQTLAELLEADSD